MEIRKFPSPLGNERVENVSVKYLHNAYMYGCVYVRKQLK